MLSGIRKLILLFISIYPAIFCTAQTAIFPYDLAHPEIIELPKKVDEISGIVYKDGHVFSIDDEHGELYKIQIEKNPQIEYWRFGKDQDYEDVVLVNKKFYVLNSNGTIIQFAEQFPISETTNKQIDIKGKKEFESLYYDPAIKKIVMLCKECAVDDKDENSAWAFDPASKSFDNKPLYVIKRKDIEKTAGKKISRFKPSAATINPFTGELYILSSINKILVIVKGNKILQVIPLERKLFKQPEGITFSDTGNLLISNEATKEGPATILVFNRK
jgi:hypothetical protein